jgi:hypothetical protein
MYLTEAISNSMEESMRERIPFALVLISLLLPSILFSQAQSSSPTTPSSVSAQLKVVAVRTSEPVVVDGVLSESVWRRPGVTDFKQKRPFEGSPPSQKTEVWVAYDGEAVYVAARMHDTAPDSIMQVLGRRDQDLTADWFALYIDPYYDKRSGFFFAVSAAGSLVDGTLYNDEWDDDTWDGVWEGRAHIDGEGWTAEMKIPYSQLRFQQKPSYVWGVNFRRSIGRHYERDFIVYTPNKESGFVSRFVDLVGIDNVTPPRDIQVLPYITTRAEYTQHPPNDPFHDGARYLPGLGADFKVGLGSNLTLDATVNPDFGQVEVDPAVVNLSDVETFYQEKRPFFIEGANTFSFGRGGSNNYWSFNWGDPDIFYSRRIGRSPQGSLPSYDYADLPLGTHIIGAGKLTGKIAGTWNIGMIHALTSREFAEIQSGNVKSSAEIEPLTYYGVARAQRDFNEGKQGLGVMTTLASRDFSDQSLRSQINSNALVVGVDGWTFLDSDKSLVLTGWSALSTIHGSQSRMIALQRESRHYLQRPDASHVRVDSAATSLTGYGARFMVNKQKGSMTLNAAIGLIDPKFDVNDLGFLWRTDVINYHFATGYKWTDPTGWYNNINFNVAIFGSYNFGGIKTWHGYWASGYWELPSFYSFRLAYAYNPYSYDTRSTRGGPTMLNPLGWEVDFGFSSDSRKPVVLGLYGFTYLGGGGEQYSTEADIQVKPMPNITLSVGPSLSRNITQAQWVGSYEDPYATQTFGNRYVFADLNQVTLAANIRLNWTFTPHLSLQLFAQPLISSGAYRNFKEFLQPSTFNFQVFGTAGSTIKEQRDVAGAVAAYEVDADGAGPSQLYSFSNPDFSFKSLRGNAVLRWEYRPGSTLYLVWTQSRSDSETLGEFQFNRAMSRLWSARPDNIFMLKFTYWWSL